MIKTLSQEISLLHHNSDRTDVETPTGKPVGYTKSGLRRVNPSVILSRDSDG